MMPATIATWNVSRKGRSASGIGCAPRAPLTAVTDLISVCAIRACASRAPESRAISSRASLGSSATRVCTSAGIPCRRSLSGSKVPSSRKRMKVLTAAAGAMCRAMRGRNDKAACNWARAASIWPAGAGVSPESTTTPSTHGRIWWAFSVASSRRSSASRSAASRAFSGRVPPGVRGWRKRKKSGGSVATAASTVGGAPPEADTRASRSRSTPLPPWEKSCQPATGGTLSAAASVANGATGALKMALNNPAEPAAGSPVRTSRGARWRRNRSLSGVTSCKIGFCKAPGNLPTKPSSRSKSCRNVVLVSIRL